jgi:hypothetical protein
VPDLPQGWSQRRAVLQPLQPRLQRRRACCPPSPHQLQRQC